MTEPSTKVLTSNSGNGLHICHISSMHTSDDDRIFQRCCLGLASAGCKVSFIVTHPIRENLLGVEIYPLQERSSVKRRLLSSYEAFRIALTVDADVFHFHDPDLLPWMYLLAKKGRKVVYDIHENYLDRTRRLPFPKLATKIFKFFENGAVRKLSGIVTVSDSLSKIYEGHYQRQCVVHNVVNLSRLKSVGELPPKTDYPLVYTSGIINGKRACIETVEAIAIVAKQYPTVKMVFAGLYGPPDNYKEILEQHAANLGISNNVECQGMLPWLDNFKRTATAHIGIVVAEDTPNARVALSNRMFEYMYSRIPIVIEDMPEFKRLTLETNCGIVVNSRNIEEFANAIIELIAHPEKAAQLGNNGYNAVIQKYNLESELVELLSFYRKIVAEKQP